MYRTTLNVAILAGMIAILGVKAWGQAAPKLTLSQALTTAHRAEGETVLAVSANSVTLPKDAAPPTSDASLDQVAAAFGFIAVSYGRVTVAAPATMTLLNDQPDEPDLTQNINTYQTFPVLAASLDDSQWKLLTSSTGIGLADLTTDTQKSLFWAMFPDHTLQAAPEAGDGTPTDPASATDFTTELPSARLRLSQTAILYPPSANGEGTVFNTISIHASSTTHWVAVRGTHPPRKTIYGALVKAEIPNALKTTDLDLDQLPLQTPIPLAGPKTVGELVARIASASKLELYADRHYADKPLTILGNSPTANAPSLLRGLMLCVTGTFRRVGPAYVLTDSLVGNTAYRKIWANYEDHVRSLASKPWEDATASLFKNHSAYSLPTFGDPIAPTLEQETPDPTTSMGKFLPQVPETEKLVPFAKLTPGQQSAARRIFLEYQDNNADEIAKDPTQAIVLRGKWGVMPESRLEAVLPSQTQPIELSHHILNMLFAPPTSVFASLQKQMDVWDAAQKAKTLMKPVPTLAALLKQTPRRAVLAAPHTPEEITSLVSTMKTLGLNQLWLYVFTDGKARVPNTPFSTDKTEDLLQAALDATKGTGITVCPVADLLTWGQLPPLDVQDVNVLGETSVQIDARRQQDSPEEYTDKTAPPAGMSVSPFAPGVQTDLTALVQKVASYPGIGAMVWRKVAIAEPLGDTLAARLAFLRRAHTDPLDVPEDTSTRLDFHLPNWDDDKIGSAIEDEWGKFRVETYFTLLRNLSDAAKLKGTNAILVDAQDNQFSSLAQTLQALGAGGLKGEPISLPSLTLATITATPDDDALTLAAKMQDTLKGSSWDGVVLDIAERDGGVGITGLRTLVQKSDPLRNALPQNGP